MTRTPTRGGVSRRYRVAVAVAVAVLGIIVYLALDLHWRMRAEVMSRFQRQQLVVARHLASEVASYLQAREQGLRALASFASLRNHDPKQAANDLKAYFDLLRNRHVRAVSAYDESGTIFASTFPEAVGRNDAGREFFGWARPPESQGRFFLAPPLAPERPMGKPDSLKMLLVTPISRAEDGGFAGVVSMSVDLGALLVAQLAAFVPGGDRERYQFWVLDADGTLLVHSHHPEMAGRNARQDDERCRSCHASLSHVDRMLAQREGTVDYFVRGAGARIASFVPMEVENARWTLVASAGTEEVTRFVRNGLYQTLLLLGVTVLTLLGGAAFVHRNERSRIRAEEDARQSQEKRALEEQVSQSEARYRTIVETAHDAIWMADTAGNFTFLNRRAEEMGGYSAAELMGQPYTPLVNAEDLPAVREILLETLAGKPRAYTIRVNTRSGRPLILRVHSIPFFEEGKVVGTVSFGKDITEEKQALEALRESEERYRKLVDASPDTVAVHSEGKLVFVNGAGAALLGAGSPEDLIGRPVLDFVHPDFRQAVSERIQRSREEGRQLPPAEQVFLRLDGTPVDVEVVSIPLTFGGRPANLFIARDITERKRAEARLREAETLYRTIFETSPDGVLLIDPESGETVEFNDAACRNLGYTREEFSRLRISDYEALETPDETVARARKILDEGKEVFETRHRTKQGELRNVLVTVQKIQLSGRTLFYAVYHDITERKRMTEELRETRDYLENLINHANAPIVVWDPGARITRFNRAFERLTGYASAETVGQELGMLFSAESREESIGKIARAAAGEHWESVEIPIACKDGRVRVALWNSANIHAADGSIVATIAQGTDITERQRLEEQYRQAQKMEAVGRLAGGVAHDFNNLLTVILGYSDILLMRLEPNDPGREDVEEIKKAGDRATALTRQLLAFSRKQVLKTEILDLNKIVGGIENMLRRLIGEDISVMTVLDPALGRTEADPGQIEQVILNLAVNARDAMPGGGKLTIDTRNADVDAEHAERHAAFQPGRYVVLSVSDTGCGMDEHVKEHLFEPFFTTKETGRGTGLGLATVYGIVKQSDGFIWVYSEPGIGSTFKVYLRRADQAVGRPVSDKLPTVSGGRETVLLVEDDPLVRSLTRRMLEGAGYTVLTTVDGNEALAVAQGCGSPIDLLLTDVVMPGLGGPELAARLAPPVSGIGVLFMTGYSGEAAVRSGLVEKDVCVVTKPFTAATLLRMVREVLDARSTRS